MRLFTIRLNVEIGVFRRMVEFAKTFTDSFQFCNLFGESENLKIFQIEVHGSDKLPEFLERTLILAGAEIFPHEPECIFVGDVVFVPGYKGIPYKIIE